MSVEVAMYILGAGIVPLIGWMIRLHMMISNTAQVINEIKEVSKSQSESTARLADVMEDLAELLRWTMDRNGDPLPPPHVRSVTKK